MYFQVEKGHLKLPEMMIFHIIENIKKIAKSIGELILFLRDIQLPNCVLACALCKYPLLRSQIENCGEGKVATKNEENNHPQPAVF